MPEPSTCLLSLLFSAIKFCLCLTGKKGKGPKASKLPDPLPEGEILKDIRKGQWKIGKAIGAGGFGLIYTGDVPCYCILF